MNVIEHVTADGKKMRLDIDFDDKDQCTNFEKMLIEILTKLAESEDTFVGNLYGEKISNAKEADADVLLSQLVSKFVNEGK